MPCAAKDLATPPRDAGCFALSEGNNMLGLCTAMGEIDLATAPTCRATLRDTIDHSDVESVVVDCTGLTFMDSQGFHALVNASEYAIRHATRWSSETCPRRALG